jgi:predicted enzyme related to lactoylglutathione lyase
MTTTPEYSDGAPCWADLSTHDLAGAQRFYGALLGWSFDEPNPRLGGYLNARIDGQPVAGMMQAQPEMHMPTTWGVHLMTRDMAATRGRIEEAGGKVILCHDVPFDLGTMLLATDVTGAVFGAWQPKLHRGAERFDEPGALAWAEVYTREAAATDRFYRSVFDYQQAPMANSRGVDYALYSRDGRDVCGRLRMTAAWGDMPPHWAVYFRVCDIDGAITRVRQQGGRLIHEPFDSPRGRIAFVADPQGAMFAIIARPANG